MRASHPGLLLAFAVALLFMSIVWLLASGRRGAEVAAVLTLGVALLGLAGPALRPDRSADHETLTRSARSLAGDVRRREAAEQQKFLADSGQAVPADIGFRQPEVLHWRTDGGGPEGSLSDIEGFYAGLGHGRLVVLGEAGAGKTVLANQLLLDLIAALPLEGPPPGTTLKVPVRLSLSSFSPASERREADGSEESRQFDGWVSGYLAEVHGVPVRQARILVREGWVLPVLDGLDELDPASEPVRAAAVIRALNHPVGSGLRRVILTCRTDRYQQLAASAAVAGQRPVLQDATAIAIQPLTAMQISAYLTSRFADPARRGSVQRRWEPVVRAIADSDSPLGSVLSSPFYLYVAVTAYDAGTTCPAELLGRPADGLRAYLLDLLIPAVTAQHPGPHSTGYDPADVTRWLTAIACHLRARRVRYRESGTDIRMHELWAIVGERAPRYLTALLIALLAPVPLLIGGLSVGLLDSLTQFWAHLPIVPYRLRYAPLRFRYAYLLAPYAVLFSVVGSYCFARARRFPVILTRLDPAALRSRPARRRLVRGLAAGIIAGFVIIGLYAWRTGVSPGGWVSLLLGGWDIAPRIFLSISILGGIALGIANQPTAIRRPGQLVRQGLTYDITILVVFSTVITGIFVTAGLGDPSEGIVNGKNWVLFAFGLTMAVTWLSDSPWPRYLIAIIIGGRRRLPRRPARFLDWAYSTGLLRLAGISAQFRHSEFQEHLTAASGELDSTSESTEQSPDSTEPQLIATVRQQRRPARYPTWRKAHLWPPVLFTMFLSLAVLAAAIQPAPGHTRSRAGEILGVVSFVCSVFAARYVRGARMSRSSGSDSSSAMTQEAGRPIGRRGSSRIAQELAASRQHKRSSMHNTLGRPIRVGWRWIAAHPDMPFLGLCTAFIVALLIAIRILTR